MSDDKNLTTSEKGKSFCDTPSDAEFRLHLGELTMHELLIAKAAYRFAESQLKRTLT